MATKGIINLDVGILMGSRSPQVFQEMVDLYPGVRRIFDEIAKMPCECGKPLCSQNCFQVMLGQGSHGKPELAAKLLEELAALDELDYEKIREYQYDFFTRHQPKFSESGPLYLDGFSQYLPGR